MMSLTGLLVTARITVTYGRARYSPHSLRHSAITFILGAYLCANWNSQSHSADFAGDRRVTFAHHIGRKSDR